VSTCSTYITWVLLGLAPERKTPSRGWREEGRAVLGVRLHRMKHGEVHKWEQRLEYST